MSQEELGKSLNEIIKHRLEKLSMIRKLGYNPYQYVFNRTHSCKSILENYDDLKESVDVSVAGRLMSVRRMGRASFAHIQDQSGRLQIYIQENKVGKTQYKLFSYLDIGDIIGVTGKVFKTKTGETTVFVEKLEILTKNIRPLPVVKEKEGKVFDAFTDKEQRYRQREVDLNVNPHVRDIFVLRSKIIGWTRDFFVEHGYLEVETPILQPVYGGAAARPFKTYYNALDQVYYLRIALEIYLKRLIVGGYEKVFEIGKTFRNEGIDRNHNPEFTLLEFYETYVDYYYMMDFVEKYFKYIASKVGKSTYRFEGHDIDIMKKFNRVKLFDLLNSEIGEDLYKADVAKLRKICDGRNIEYKPEWERGKLIDELFKEFVEPKLIQPTFVMDYPVEISPFAKPARDGREGIVERFELFIGGQEFANSFSELNDPLDQRSRMERQKRLKDKGDEEATDIDKDFLVAMEYGMPPTGGVGIGMDRVVMLFTEQKSIRDVIFFPQLRSLE